MDNEVLHYYNSLFSRQLASIIAGYQMSKAEESREPPFWLNEAFFEEVLSKTLKEPSLKVNSLNIAPAVGVGENYASLIFRTSLEIKRKASEHPEKMSLICKTLPRGKIIQQLVKAGGIFDNEAKMLMEILPEISRILKNADLDHGSLCAQGFWFSKHPEEIIVMQDLKQIGFQLCDRMNGLDMATSLFVLQNLAKIHASSLALFEKQPVPEEIKYNFWSDPNNIQISEMLKGALAGLIEEVSTWSEVSPKYVEKLKALKSTAVEKLRESAKLDEKSPLNVLLHGDCWINNMMFKKSLSGEVSEMKFLDFQISTYGSPAVDLNYFIFTSPSSQIRIDRLDDMLQIYFDTFQQTAQLIGARNTDQFTFDALKEEFKRKAFFGLFAIITIYPVTITKTEEVMKADEFFEEARSKRKIFQNDIFKESFKNVLSYFDACGIL